MFLTRVCYVGFGGILTLVYWWVVTWQQAEREEEKYDMLQRDIDELQVRHCQTQVTHPTNLPPLLRERSLFKEQASRGVLTQHTPRTTSPNLYGMCSNLL